jgi:polysaccharide biosynthesis/export protein
MNVQDIIFEQEQMLSSLEKGVKPVTRKRDYSANKTLDILEGGLDAEATAKPYKPNEAGRTDLSAKDTTLSKSPIDTKDAVSKKDNKLATLAESNIDYFIAPEDVLEIFVWQNPDLSKNVIVGSDGKVSYPLAGMVKAAGLTIEQLQEELKDRLSKYIKYPQITVMVTKFAGNKVVILGEIKSPGVYSYAGQIDLLKLVGMSGDFTRSARSDSVIVVSGNLTNKPQVRRLNLKSAMYKGTSDPSFMLSPGDVVYVPRSYIADFNRFLDSMRPILDIVTRFYDVNELGGIGGTTNTQYQY